MEDFQEQEYEFLRRLDEERFGRGTLLKRGLATAAGLTVISLPEAALAARAKALADPPIRGTKKNLSALVAAAKKEGHLNVIALPPDWANYGEIISTFTKKYGIGITSDNPNGSSSEENQALVSLKGDPRAPDVVDVSPTFAVAGTVAGLYTRYYVSNYATVPRSMKDTRGLWTGDYYGSVTIGYNANVVKTPPKTFADLLKSIYKNQVALNGSPLKSGSAVAGVFAAALANGGSLSNVSPGIDWFAKLRSNGNWVPTETTPQTVASGQTPISIDWDYNNFAYVKEFPSANWKVVLPSDGQYGGYYCQAVSATAPHPWAARLWQEFLFSDQGQILYLKGYAHPARIGDLLARKAIPKSVTAALPASWLNAKGAKFASLGQQTKAGVVIKAEWPAKIGTSSLATQAATHDRLRPGPKPGRRFSLAWLGVVPFFAYASMFLILPAATVMIGAFRSDGGGYTLDNVRAIVQTSYIRDAFWESIRISLTTALLGALFGLLLAYAAIRKGTPNWVRSAYGTFSGVAANFGGIPLAFAFIATLGTIGIVTQLSTTSSGSTSTSTASRSGRDRGVELVYLYFQIPLMFLVIAPAIDGLRAEWSEASSNLGASRWQYWRHIGMPVLMPSILGAVILLFGNSFAAYATAYSLTSGAALPLVPILIGSDLSGNVLSNPHEGQALALGMFVVLAAMMLFYIPLQRRASRWAK